MPTYGYRCSRGHHWEVVQRMTEAALTQCPECAAPATRVFYPVGVVFKGQGFYKTDSRGSGGIAPGATSDGAGSSDGKAEGKADGKSDGKSGSDATKTDTKTESKTKAASDGAGKTETPSTPPAAKSEEKG